MNGTKNRYSAGVLIRSVALLVALAGCAESVSQSAKTVKRFRLSQDNPDYSLTETGTLIIVGGAARDSLIFAAFLENAGGPEANIVVVPTAGADQISEKDLKGAREYAERWGAKNITVLHTKDRDLANSDDFAQPLRNATGVWFTGGRQWRIADSFLGTKTHEEFNNLLKRGGVIGGSSAGATIQGAYLARGDTKGNLTMMGDHEEGLNFFPNTAIDQHLLKRNRQFDLIEIIETYPELLGIGLDENTAIVVHGDTFKVIGAGYVAIYDAAVWNSNILSNNGKFFLLSAGDEYNFKERKMAKWRTNGRKIKGL